jgi:transcriptional regulator with XRE-family HTH domain
MPGKQQGLPHIGQKIRQLRVLRGFTQEKLSHDIDMTSGNLGKIERAEIDPNTETLYKIARALKVDLADLFSETDLVAEPIEKSGFVTREELSESIRALEQLIRSELAAIRSELADRRNSTRGKARKQGGRSK